MITKIHTLLTNVVCTSRLKTIAVASLLIVAGCNGPNADPPAKRDHPIVTTYPTTQEMVDEVSATLTGAIIDLGTGVRDHGFYYGTLSIGPGTLSTSDKLSLGPKDKAENFEATATADLIKGKLYYARAYATSATTGVIVFGDEITFTAKGSAAPTFTHFEPQEGIAGDTVVISGTNFSSLADNNTVLFGDAFAPIVKASPTELRVVVPLSTKAGKNIISVDVVGQQVTNTVKFNLLTMTITSFEPSDVAIADTVWFHGTNLPLVPSMSAGTILLRTALTATSTRTLIGCVVGNDAAAISSDVTIVVGSQSAHFAGPITLKAPVINLIDPVRGPGESLVHILGENFNPDPLRNKVTFGTTACEVVEASKTTLVIKVPPFAGIGTVKNFSVTLLDALTGTSAQGFEVTQH